MQTKFLIVSLLALSMVAFVPLVFSIFYLAKKLIKDYISPAVKNTQHKRKMNKEIQKLIEDTKGKFFSITFQKKDGTLRTINGKNKYANLIRGIQNSHAIKGLRNAGYVSAINRNNKGWFSFKPEAVRHFKCGQVEKFFV